ncbi:DUF421 domain-containing protein [Agrococcus lahaulensis]|uniref:DUF421 domain-containing protein n=1 Tax=Agrococcus lahaulensis TaxID=341722 RepID=UPI00047CAFE8|nr:YetF domain-containing protein [Agrococcus lahaulensis]
MWFDSWSDVFRVLLVGTASYAALIVVLRVYGKRTLSQLNAFDFVVTVALGSTLATILLSSDVSFLEGLTAFVLLATLQLMIAVVTSRVAWARRATTARPVLLVRDGRLDEEALRRNRMSETDVLQAVRSAGKGDLGAIAAVVLEATGALSVVATSDLGDGSALADVEGR